MHPTPWACLLKAINKLSMEGKIFSDNLQPKLDETRRYQAQKEYEKLRLKKRQDRAQLSPSNNILIKEAAHMESIRSLGNTSITSIGRKSS